MPSSSAARTCTWPLLLQGPPDHQLLDLLQGLGQGRLQGHKAVDVQLGVLRAGLTGELPGKVVHPRPCSGWKESPPVP